MSLNTFLHPVRFLFFLSVCIGCNAVNPAEPVPAYVKLQDPVVVDAATNDTLSEKITNTWIYLDGQPLGVFNRTHALPVIGKGQHVLTFIPGIMENGVAAFRQPYPFYSADTVNAVLTPNEDIVVAPQYRYLAGTQIPFNETFDQLGLLMTPTPQSMATLHVFNGADALQGNSGYAAVTVNDTLFEYESVDDFYLTSSQGSIYVELDYKNASIIHVGLKQVASGAVYYGWHLNPRADWNKVYFNIKDAVASSGGGDYKLMLRTERPPDTDTALVFFDNVKVLHF